MRAALLACLIALVAAGCGGDDGNDATTTSAAGECEQVAAPDPRDAPTVTAPEGTLDPAKTWQLTFETSCGDFTVDLDLALAPETTASLVHLAREGFYDDTVFHRIVPGFVIQGGDPTQPGTARYTKGTMAMAKSPLEPAGTAGSQFFVVSADGVNLQPEYAVVGRVSEGLDVVERIGALGDANEQPTQPVVIRTVTVTES
jgi:peptidyl-prolyl cis-trans isomerase B (cyclophilin B)